MPEKLKSSAEMTVFGRANAASVAAGHLASIKSYRFCIASLNRGGCANSARNHCRAETTDQRSLYFAMGLATSLASLVINLD